MSEIVLKRKACENVVVNENEIPNSKVVGMKINNDHTVNVVIEVKADKVFFSHSKEFADSLE